jgi:hypothetical protein
MRRLLVIPQSTNNPQSLIPIPTPSLNATATGTNTISLVASYTGPPTLNQYQFYQLISGSWSLLANQTAPNYVVGSLTANTTYYFYVSITTTETPSRTSQAGFANATTSSASSGKWNPGFYGANDSTGQTANTQSTQSASRVSEINTYISPYSYVKGYNALYFWGAVEDTTQGVPGSVAYPGTDSSGYITQWIDADLAACISAGKQYVLTLQFGGGPHYPASGHGVIPTYLQNGSTYGNSPVGGSFGWWGIGNSANGVIPQIWNTNVQARIQALLTHLGARYDSNANFEGIIVGWTAAPLTNGTSGATLANYISAWETISQYAKNAFPTSSVALGVDYGCTISSSSNSQTDIANLVANVVSIGVGISGPDTFGANATGGPVGTRYTFGQAAILGLIGSGGNLTLQIPMMQCVQTPEMDGSSFGSIGAPFAIPEFIDNGDALNSSHMAFTVLQTGSSSGAGNGIAAWTAGFGVNPVTPTLAVQSLTRTAYPTY